MALFSQDDSDDDETPTMGAAFSGGPSPDDPDDEKATPSPADGDEQQQAPGAAEPDDSNAYAQSPDEEEPNQSSAPSDDGEPAGQYSQSAALGTGAATLPSQPVLADNSANQAELEYAKSHFSPADYKPSIGRKILGSLAGAATTFGGGNGNQVVQNVESKPLREAQAVEAQKESAINQRIADVNSQNQTRQATYQNQRVAANDAALNDQRSQRAQDYAAQAAARSNAIVQFTPKDPNNPYAGGTGVTAGGKTVENVAPPDKWLTNWERDPANKAKADAERGVQTLKALEASGVKLTPEQRAIVASGGKVTPSVRTTVNIRENPDGSAVVPGNGRGQNQGMTQAQRDVILQAKQQGMTDAQKQLAAGVYTPEQARTEMQSVQDTFEQKVGVDPNGPQHTTINPDFTWTQGGKTTSAPAQQTAAAQPQARPQQQPQPQTFQYKGQTFSAGQTVNIDGKPAVVKGLNPQTGKLIVGAQ